MYRDLFERNYGIFTDEEQEKIKNAKVVIIGCGGVGGPLAVCLARSGLEKFVLFEGDNYEPSNMNRQIICFSDTIGMNKGVLTKESILRINPEADVTLFDRMMQVDEIDEVIQMGDIIIPAADEWPLSITILGKAKEQGKPSIMMYPVGALARVSTFLSDSPYAAECLVMPYMADYKGLKAYMEDPVHRSALQYYQTTAGWTQEWFEGFVEGKKPHAQICPIVWISSSLAALEVIKLVTGKWEPVVAPRYWHITPAGGHIARFGIGRRLLSRLVTRSWGKKLLPAISKRAWLVRLFTRVISK
jgi:molybdopterin/thiamine biosynthesis adenylyltransferase